MLSNVPYNQKNPKLIGQNKNLIGIRGGAFYGIKYEKLKVEPSSYKRGIIVSPNFYFYNNFTQVMIDFSDYKNTISKELVDEYFKLNLTGLTFTINQGEWINDALTSKKVSMSGTYTLVEYKNNILFANVSSLQYYDSNIKRYDKNYFVNTPNFILSVSGTQQNNIQTNIINIFGSNSSNSFSYLGAQVGDYIAISNKNIKYQIANIQTDEEGKEIITINGEITEEDRITSITDVILYIEKSDNTNVNDYDNTKIGSCNLSKDGITTCLNSHTEAQCQFRKNTNLKQTSSFSSGNFCSDVKTVVRQMSPTEKLTVIAEQNNKLLTQMQLSPVISSSNRII